MEELVEDHRISEIEEVENQDRTKINSDNHIKSEATITHKKKEESQSFEELLKTVKKPSTLEQTIHKDDTATKTRRNVRQNIIYPITTRLSQMSIFGGGMPSLQNVVSAFSLLEESEPVALEPQPSFNDLSLSINCLDSLEGEK